MFQFPFLESPACDLFCANINNHCSWLSNNSNYLKINSVYSTFYRKYFVKVNNSNWLVATHKIWLTSNKMNHLEPVGKEWTYCWRKHQVEIRSSNWESRFCCSDTGRPDCRGVGSYQSQSSQITVLTFLHWAVSYGAEVKDLVQVILLETLSVRSWSP